MEASFAHPSILPSLTQTFWRQVCDLVHAFNGHHGQIVAAYTFDAGPNAVIFVPKSHHATLVTFMLYFFPLPESCSMENYSNRPGVLEEAATVIANGGMPEGLLEAGSATGRRPRAGDVKMMYCTKVSQHLIGTGATL